MRKIILLFFLIYVVLDGFTQNVPSAVMTKSEEIAKSRRILLDKFIEDDKLGIMLEMDRLMMLDNNDYLALYPVEFWLLSYWLGDYEAILLSDKSLRVDSLTNDRNLRIPPQRDYLIPKLFEKSAEKKDTLLQHIKNSKLTEEEKAFMLMKLRYLLSESEDTERKKSREELNLLADDFLTRYPDSEYADFTRRFIRVKYEITRNGFAYSLYLGKFLFSGNLTDYYRHPTLFGFSMEAIKRNWVYQLNLSVGFSKTKTDMPANKETWPQNSKATGGQINLSAGRYIIDTKNFAFAPLLGVGIFGLDPNSNTNKEPDYKGAGIKTSIAGNIGFISDIKLKTKDNSNSSYYLQGTSTTSIRIGYDFIATPLKNNFLDYSGTVHKVTIGIGISSRRIQRVH
ncbi:MAG: hypothetical protein QM594_22075 [Niabella sp.]